MLWLLRFIGGILGRLAYYVGVRREVTLANLRIAYPETSGLARHSMAVRSYSSLGQVFSEFLYLRYASETAIRNGLPISNLAEVVNLLSSPKGVILLSAHLGNWEWLGLGCGLRVRPLNLIVMAQRSSFAERFLLRMRTRFGNKMIDAGDVRRIFRTLQQGELAAILGDQSSHPESVRVPFFGVDVPTFEGTARLALRTGAPILFLQPVEKTARGYRCMFHHIRTDDLPEGSPESVRILTARHTAFLESVIREKPELWLWQHRRWKHMELSLNERP
jgi:KDO2-lipid IV(A) lauroyltransferase